MIVCTKCEVEKSLEEFPWKNKKAGKKATICKACQRAYAKQHHLNNKQYYVEKAKVAKEKSLAINREYIKNYLEKHYCVDCGEDDYVVLEFDHQRDKLGNISQMVFGTSLAKLKKEVAKCEVVCANCHKRRTAEQFGFYKWRD
jgi:hypothetical protein